MYHRRAGGGERDTVKQGILDRIVLGVDSER
jgi:hypothetical protein